MHTSLSTAAVLSEVSVSEPVVPDVYLPSASTFMNAPETPKPIDPAVKLVDETTKAKSTEKIDIDIFFIFFL